MNNDINIDVWERTAARARHAGTPRVSIVIPSYNHERFVARTIESALAQTYQDFEIVITDDASTDRSVDVLSSYARTDSRIKLFVNRFNYETHAVNHCIQHSSGDYIAMLSSDDEFFPAKLEKQVEVLDRRPEVAAVFTQARIVDEHDRDFPEPSHFYCTIFQQPNRPRHEWLRHFFFKGNCLCHPSVLVRRSVYDTLGLYNPLMGALDDLDMWVRVCLHHEIHVLPDRLVNFRIRDADANVSADTPENFRRGQFELIKILDHFLSSEAFAQLHLIFPELADQLLHEPDSVKQHVLAKAALEGGHLPHRFWGIDLLYRLLSHPDTRRQLSHRIGRAPDVDFVKLNGALNPFALEHRSTAQVFWPDAGAYGEVNSRSKYCPRSQWTEMRFPLPAWDAGSPLRFDPCDCPGVVKIAALRILSQADGRCLWSCPPEIREEALTLAGTARWLSHQANLAILSTGTDPQLYLRGIPPLPDLPLELQVWIKLEPGLDSAARELDSAARELDSAARELDSTARELDSTARELDSAVREIDSLRAIAVHREERLQQLETFVDALKTAAAGRDAEIDSLRATAVHREERLQQVETFVDVLKTAAAGRDAELERLTAQADTLKATVAERDRETTLMLNSRSWRFTRPLRALNSLLHWRRA